MVVPWMKWKVNTISIGANLHLVHSLPTKLTVGQQDYRVVGDSGMSNKQKKAFQLLEKGQDIEILSETEFLSRI